MGKNGGRTTAHVQAFGMRISARAPFRPQSGGGPSEECRLCLANTGRSFHSRKANELFLQTGGRGQRTAGKLRQVAQNLPFGVQEEESRPDCSHMKRWNSSRGKGNGFFASRKMQKAGSFLLEKPRAAFHAFSFPIVPKAPGTSYFFAEKEAVAQLSFCNSPYFMDFPGQQSAYLANSVLRVSRITLTRIWPGYSISFSMRLAISLARILVPSSVTSSGLTIMRTSRPDWIA